MHVDDFLSHFETVLLPFDEFLVACDAFWYILKHFDDFLMPLDDFLMLSGVRGRNVNDYLVYFDDFLMLSAYFMMNFDAFWYIVTTFRTFMYI